MTVRVAFALSGGKNWTGGYNYLRNLIEVLATEVPGEVTPLLIAGADSDASDLAPFRSIKGCQVVVDPVMDQGARSSLQARCLLLGRDGRINRIIREHEVDVIFESAIFLGWRLACPAMAWMPDFQHIFLSDQFSWGGWLRREAGFRAQVMAGRRVMVSSEDSRSACERVYRSSVGKVQAVRFAVRAPEPIDGDDARRVAARYGVKPPFFFMPNQFWRHKNHRIVTRAVALLREQGEEVTILATGLQFDPRHPEYAQQVVAEISSLGLSERIVTPGLVPYGDLKYLMRASSALLNPSLFEGWSTSVEEAKSAGVPLILSDIEVHREQAGDQAVYFDRHSAEALSLALRSHVPQTEAERQRCGASSAAESAARVRRFAEDFTNLARQTAGHGVER